VTFRSLENPIEINTCFAKSELFQTAAPSTPARAIFHVEEALKELSRRQAPGDLRSKQAGKSGLRQPREINAPTPERQSVKNGGRPGRSLSGT
jgi:hypothetical protein